MGRKLRVEYPGAIYRVMSRGDHCEAIFNEDWDRGRLLESLGAAGSQTGWQILAGYLVKTGTRDGQLDAGPQPARAG